jgi:uncharacterized protein YkwD
LLEAISLTKKKMKLQTLVLLLFSVALSIAVYVDEIGPPPKKINIPLVPHARYPPKKHKHLPVRFSRDDYPEASFRFADYINKYREESGLETLQVSPSLMFVAFAHSLDMQSMESKPGCGVNSWSDKPDLWKGCCSNADNLCFDTKVQELTSYPGVGVELVFATNFTLRPETFSLILSAWTNSPLHKDVILNSGDWAGFSWKSIGVGINSEGYATVWFGALIDTLPWAPSTPSPTGTSEPRTQSPTENAIPFDTSRTWSPSQNDPNTWNPTQDNPNTWSPRTWYPTQNDPRTWYPEYPRTWSPESPRTWSPEYPRTWYPTQNYPRPWYPTQNYPTQVDPMDPRTEHRFKPRLSNQAYELWLAILSALVFALLISSIFMFRMICRLRESLRILMFTQNTSCAIPEKC